MKKPNELEHEEAAMGTLVELTSVFEGIASMRIAQIKNQVQEAGKFFDELWHIYSQIRADDLFRFGRLNQAVQFENKDLYIIITAEGGFSGDIDQKVVQLMLQTYNKDLQDVIVIGHHGVMQLAQRGVRFKKYFKMPTQDKNLNVTPIVREVQLYRSTTVFYQEYVSLMTQDAKSIELSRAVQEKGADATKPEELISEANYIFEPSTYDVINHLERSMMQIAISQVILGSKLAQYASRFRAMSAAHERADDSKAEIHLQFNRAKRALKDERLKEIINGLRKARLTV